MKNKTTQFVSSLVLFSSLAACSADDRSQSQVSAAWDAANNPAVIATPEYERSWQKLPLTGVLTNKGWSDDYWPTYKGGITHRWIKKDHSYAIADMETLRGMRLNDLSPAEKYDVFMERFDFPTVKDERKRTRIMKTVEGSPEYDASYEIPQWEGLCHGWAPAAHNFLEPKRSVKVQTPVGDMEFFASDIKALLTYYHQYSGNRSTRTSFVSRRCEVKFAELDEKLAAGEIDKKAWEDAREGACGDVNAATFHLVLANEIGIKKLGFLLDVTRDFEVWNQPVNEYTSYVLEEKAEAGEGSAPGTVREITVETRMNYTVESEPSIWPVGASELSKVYQYILELNASDEVIGGRWISEDRPDFLWRESVPEFRGYFGSIIDLYEQATRTE